MARFPTYGNHQSELTIWETLKQAIAASSGFQRWQLEHLSMEAQIHELNLDHQVRLYLRETLETLAY